MKTFHRLSLLAALAFTQTQALAGFDSGSTGADGALMPTANTVVPLPLNGVLNYTSVSIPAGVTVRFQKNVSNTPVTMLVSGNVTIAGTIDIRGDAGANSAQPVVLGVTNKGGAGGPGGFSGGMGGAPEQNRNGGIGFGPGGGSGATATVCYKGGGGGFATQGSGSNCGGAPGPTYGSNAMLPVIGGSGGGGGGGGANAADSAGAGGGGGGGALLLVSSGTVTITGQIRANGGAGGECAFASAGGGGSGGMVRILAVGISASGPIDISGGLGGCPNSMYGSSTGGPGGDGRKSLEIVPNGGSFSLNYLPSLAIISIGGAAVPINPSGAGDVSVPMASGNPLSVTVSASGVPTGTVVKLTLNNNSGTVTSVNTSALAGTQQASTATGSIGIPGGASVLMASTTYTLTIAMGEALKTYAGGERVEKVSLATVMGGEMQVTLITVSGNEFVVPAAVLATALADLS